ncbi:uncharacterized protein [Diadema setosum]|uniref:uncharacterized protein n=1 Tax=Diadema setosum TaxID=31175 RepID=UPI003B3A6FD7
MMFMQSCGQSSVWAVAGAVAGAVVARSILVLIEPHHEELVDVDRIALEVEDCLALPLDTSKDLEWQRNVSFRDRKVNAEAMVTSFAVENGLTFTVVPKIIDLAKALAKDKKVLDDLHMERTTCAYKLNEGLASQRCSAPRNTALSINLDECTSNANEKVLSILVSYFSDTLNMCVVQHYTVVTLTVVSAETVFQTVLDILKNDNIPLDNIVRGKKSGFETRLRDVAPHLLNIDGDICHHTHNAVKNFGGFFNNHVEYLADDLYDLKWSPLNPHRGIAPGPPAISTYFDPNLVEGCDAFDEYSSSKSFFEF